MQKTEPKGTVKCRTCNYTDDSINFIPSAGNDSAIQCPVCHSGDNAHNDMTKEYESSKVKQSSLGVHGKSNHQMQVEAFMLRAGQEVPLEPTEPSEEVRLLRAKLIFEEAMKTIHNGLGVDVIVHAGHTHKPPILLTGDNRCDFTVMRPFDLIETIDGVCDLSVVSVSTLSACGIPDEMFQREVDQNNLQKFGLGHTIREDGKLVKPPGHKGPRIRELLDEEFPKK